MSRIKARQMRLPFRRESLWEQLPEDRRRECRRLVSQLLSEVVLSEPRSRRIYNEPREDQAVTS